MSLSCDDAAYRRHHIWLLLHLHVRVVGLVYHWSVTCIIHHLSWLVFTCHDECVMMNRIGLLMNGNEKANEGQERAKRPKRSQGQRPALKTKRLFGSKTRSSRLNVSIGYRRGPSCQQKLTRPNAVYAIWLCWDFRTRVQCTAIGYQIG